MDKIPRVLFSAWFWMAIAAVLIAIHCFFGKAPPPPRKSPFFEKHKRTIMRTTDIFLILVMLFAWVPLGYITVSCVVAPVTEGTRAAANGLISSTLLFFAIGAIANSGMTGILVGFLSVFQTRIDKRKRVILAAVSILPVVFTVMALLLEGFDEPGATWGTIKLGITYIPPCWLINGTAIFAGQHFIRVAWILMRKLKLVSGEFPG